MICKNKFSNLYVSFENMRGEMSMVGPHLKAFFGMNVVCAMNEVLKFPGLFSMTELSDYVRSVKIFPKLKSSKDKVFNLHHSAGTGYVVEDIIRPTLLSLSNVENNMAYFFFEQHFKKNQERKYKISIGVLDASIQKAIEAREVFLTYSSFISRYKGQFLEEELIDNLIDVISLAELVQRKNNDTYRLLLEKINANSRIDSRTLYDFKLELAKEVRYINNTISFYERADRRGNATRSNLDYSGPNPYTTIEYEFKKQVTFNFDEQYQTSLQIRNLPSLPILSIDDFDTAEYTKTTSVKAVSIDSVPSFDNSYSKKHSFNVDSALKTRAENYNIDYTTFRAPKDIRKISLLKETTSEPIYLLAGHNNDLVTAPNFILLSNNTDILLPNSNYLCKTNMVESENQYFILEV